MLHPDFSKFKVGDFVALGSFVYVNGKPYPRFSEIEVIMIKRGKLVLSNGWEVKIKNREVIGTLYKLAYHADDVNLVLSKLKDNIPKK